MNKMVLTNPLRMIAFFEQCQSTDKMAVVLEKIAKDKKQPKDWKMAHLSAAQSQVTQLPSKQPTQSQQLPT
jgi:hypothetical protein